MFLAGLTPEQITLCVGLWNKRLRGTLQTEAPNLKERAEKIREELVSVRDYLQGQDPAGEEEIFSRFIDSVRAKNPKLSGYIRRIGQMIDRLDKASDPSDRIQIELLQRTIIDLENTVNQYGEYFPRDNALYIAGARSYSVNPIRKDKRIRDLDI